MVQGGACTGGLVGPETTGPRPLPPEAEVNFLSDGRLDTHPAPAPRRPHPSYRTILTLPILRYLTNLMWHGRLRRDHRQSGYTGEVPNSAPGRPNPQDSPSLRAEQIAQTRAALVGAGRRLFGARGFANTSVEDLATEARVTTGALYHHFSTKAQLFEAVFEQAHAEIMAGAADLVGQAADEIDFVIRGFDLFLDAVLKPDLQRIVVIDGPAVLGLARFTELDERDAFEAVVNTLEAAVAAGTLSIGDPPTMARLLLGMATRGAMLIANSPHPSQTRQSVARSFRELLTGLATASR
jgi:AcrR family transcriptional regulator